MPIDYITETNALNANYINVITYDRNLTTTFDLEYDAIFPNLSVTSNTAIDITNKTEPMLPPVNEKQFIDILSK